LLYRGAYRGRGSGLVSALPGRLVGGPVTRTLLSAKSADRSVCVTTCLAVPRLITPVNATPPTLPSPTATPSLDAMPTGLLQTTEMDARNTTPDSNLDGIVNVAEDTDAIAGVTGTGSGVATTATANTYSVTTGLLTDSAVTAAGQTAYHVVLTYTPAGQRCTETVTRVVGYDESGNPITQSQTLKYTYDDQGQLTAVLDITDPNNVQTVESFSVDALGNRTSTGYVSNALNQYTSIPDPNNPGSTLAPTYNARGDLTSDGVFNNSFDAQDRLVQAEAKDHSVNILYSYDASGRLIGRVQQTRWNGDTQTYASSTTQLFAYDGSELVAVTDGRGTVLQRFTWGPGVAGSIGGLLSITDLSDPANPQTYRVVPDASGNTAQLIDAAGKVAGNFTYSAYGVVKSAAGPAAGLVHLLYQQMYTDPDTGVVFFPERDLAPVLGEWMQRDPSGEASDVNLRRYDDGDPINGRDPTGQSSSSAASVAAMAEATTMPGVRKATPAEKRALHALASALRSMANKFYDLAIKLAGKALVPDPMFVSNRRTADDLNRQAANIEGVAESDVARRVDMLNTYMMVYSAMVGNDGPAEAKFKQVESKLLSVLEQEENLVVKKADTELFGVLRGRSLAGITTKETGQIGETIAKRVLGDNGFKDILSLQNGSGNGIDILARSVDGRLHFLEVKASSVGEIGNLSIRQSSMPGFLKDVLTQASTGTGRYKSLSAADQMLAKTYLKEISSGGIIDLSKFSASAVGVDLKNEVLRISPWR